MKKTLALILALLMILTLALASCGKEEEETEAPTDDFFNVGGDDTDEGDETEEGDETDDKGNVTTTGYTTTNDTVYVLFDAVLREDDKTSSKKIAEAKFGTALQRAAKSKKWSQINYDGTMVYVANDLITTSKDAVTFNNVEEGTTRKVTNLGTSSNANLRLYPLALTNPSVIDMEVFNGSSIVGQIPKDTEVTVVSVSADKAWAYVKCEAKKAKGDGTYEEAVTALEGYCSVSVFDQGFGTAGSSSNSGNGALG